MYNTVSFIICIIFLFVAFNKRTGQCAKVLLMLPVISFLCGFLVDNSAHFDSFRTFANILFSYLILFLIISPWRKLNFRKIIVSDFSFFNYYKRFLYGALKVTIINNIIVLAIVLIYVPDISAFKNTLAYQNLYESIPVFGYLFRYSSISKYLGLWVLPISAMYYSKGDIKQGNKALVLSTATLIGALAFYSRAQILNYAFVVLCVYLLAKPAFPKHVAKYCSKGLKYISLGLIAIFLTISISRFSSMSYYGDRIPATSIIQEPITYSIFDYVSKGMPNGIDQLELHTTDNIIYGAQFTYDFLMALSFLHLVDWTTEGAHETFDKAYNKDALGANDSLSFHGYACTMVKNFGYILTLLISLLYYFYVRRVAFKNAVSVKKMTILLCLLVQPIVSIFYADAAVITFPLLFYLVVKLSYNMFKK